MRNWWSDFILHVIHLWNELSQMYTLPWSDGLRKSGLWRERHSSLESGISQKSNEETWSCLFWVDVCNILENNKLRIIYYCSVSYCLRNYNNIISKRNTWYIFVLPKSLLSKNYFNSLHNEITQEAQVWLNKQTYMSA